MSSSLEKKQVFFLDKLTCVLRKLKGQFEELLKERLSKVQTGVFNLI